MISLLYTYQYDGRYSRNALSSILPSASLSMYLAPARYHNAADIVDISRVQCRALVVGVRYVYEVCIVLHLWIMLQPTP